MKNYNFFQHQLQNYLTLMSDILIFITNNDLNITENNYVTEGDDGNCFEWSYLKSVQNNPDILLMSWLGTYSYLSNEKIRIGDI